MDPNHAFAYGALVKMAEHNVDPADFVRAAVQTQDPQALKIAQAIVDYEKAASMADSIAQGGKRVGQFVENLTGGGRQGAQRLMQGVDNMTPAQNMQALSSGRVGVDELAGARQLVGDQNKAMGGVAALGLGGAGVAGMQPEDTFANKARGALGMDQTSHLGGMMNRLTG
jgi:hypothetical protein